MAVTLAVIVALIATAYMFSGLIRAALAIPALGIDVGLLIKGAIVSALSLAGVANAEDGYKVSFKQNA